jgi:hypothetical protein
VHTDKGMKNLNTNNNKNSGGTTGSFQDQNLEHLMMASQAEICHVYNFISSFKCL